MLSYIDIVSLLAQEEAISKFNNVMAETSLKNIVSAIVDALEGVLDFKPQLEVMVSVGQNQQIIFREDWTYYMQGPGGPLPFDPFVHTEVVGEVFCVEKPTTRYSKAHINHALATSSFDYSFITNPLLFQLVADFLNVYLNEDQLWAKLHAKPREHFLQKYLSLESLVANKAPELSADLHALQYDVGAAKVSFSLDVARPGMSPEEVSKIYEARGANYENVITQDFWERHQVRYILTELTVKLARIISKQIPAIRHLAERSAQPTYGYDVFFASVLGNNKISVSSLGDYRVLHWEINK